jgi:thymidylate kinase
LACADRFLLLDKLKALPFHLPCLISRYTLSSLAYGCSDFSLHGGSLLSLVDPFPIPSLYFFLDLNPADCLRRISGRSRTPDLYEQSAKLEATYNNYLASITFLQSFGYSFVTLDARQPPDQLATFVANRIADRLDDIRDLEPFTNEDSWFF